MLIEELARAKINLTLEVLGRRADGYHALRSVVAFASIGDDVVLDTSRPEGRVDVTGPFAPQLPSEFLIARTLQLLAERAPQLRLGSVRLHKRLPVAAGIGGGSADAGAVLRAVARANPQDAAAVDWLGIALALGADVPVCFANRLTEMSGIGEILSPLPPLGEPLSAVLVNPLVEVPDNKTAQVFKALNACAMAGEPGSASPRFGSTVDVIDAIATAGNDLEAPAMEVVPEIRGVLDALRALPGCRVARMSGAGPTCFGIFDDAPAAAERLRAREPGWWIEPATLS